ncbi:MAG: hypothetical protein ABIK09_19105 [Pseudomonadota bacterium]
MKRSLLLLLSLLLLPMACDPAGNDGPGKTDTPAPTEDTVTPQDAATDVPEPPADTTTPEDLIPWEVDPDPGCNGDFCAAGPDHAPDPAAWGPFPVGVTTMTVDVLDHAGEPRSLRVEIWYPTTEEFRDGPFEEINIYEDAPEEHKPFIEIAKTEVPPIETRAVRDAPVRRGDGPYPIVLFSHGAYGVRYQSVFFTIPLASHGYVVASMDHPGNTLYDILTFGYDMDVVVMSSMDRPTDAIMTLTAVTHRNDVPEDMFYKSMLPDKVGMSGHSFGGFLSLLMGGLDPRIKAIVPMAPASGWLAIMGYAAEDLKIPTLLMGGLADKTLDPDQELLPLWPKLPPPKGFLRFATGGHYTFSDICSLDLLKMAEILDFGDAEDALKDGCGEMNIPVEQAHPVINQLGIGFFNHYLRESPDSLQYFDQAVAEGWSEGEILYDWIAE